MTLTFTLNGRKMSQEISPDESLLSVLRRCGCYSVRSGCDTSNCGICTVWVDGHAILSCSYPAPRAEGRSVTTMEGVRDEAQDLMTFLAEEGADQCGFCSPGFIMSVLAMLRELKDPTVDEMEQYLSGNLCRCTGYNSQHRAIVKLLEKRRDEHHV
ncbi:MAG: 2Fe-2S iron-sulfur cluster binding domain-containing protein [Clostridia bacterium]|nr:2Fe-2S iron-sulfur cluster binding domain-containing protein [Clostridia bacterium]